MSEETGASQVDQFAAVYDRHRARIYAQCLRRLRSHADADDATQVTFLRAFSAIKRGNGPRLAGPWLATIARNVCADRLSDPRQTVLLDPSELSLVDDGPDIDAGLMAEADGAEVAAAIVHIPFAQRCVLHLREVDELAYAEIAERLAMPLTAVETLLFRARANLRDEIHAARSPLRCEEARELSRAVRGGLTVSTIDRKGLRNHRADCSLCAWLPVRRARGLGGAQAAAVMVVTAIAAGARRLIATPVADAIATAGGPAKTAAVALTAGTMAAGGIAADHRRPSATPAPRATATAVHRHAVAGRAAVPSGTPAAAHSARPAALARPSWAAARVRATAGPARAATPTRASRPAQQRSVTLGSGGGERPAEGGRAERVDGPGPTLSSPDGSPDRHGQVGSPQPGGRSDRSDGPAQAIGTTQPPAASHDAATPMPGYGGGSQGGGQGCGRGASAPDQSA